MAAEAGLRGMDTLVLATALLEQLPLVTLDRELARIGAEYGSIRTIQEVLDETH